MSIIHKSLFLVYEIYNMNMDFFGGQALLHDKIDVFFMLKFV